MKLLMENWRKFLNEEELAPTAPGKRGARTSPARQEKGGESPLEKLIEPFHALATKSETFDEYDDQKEKISTELQKALQWFIDVAKQDLDFYERIKKKKGDDWLETYGADVKEKAPEGVWNKELAATIASLEDRDKKKQFWEFINALPDKKREHTLTAIGVKTNFVSGFGSWGLLHNPQNQVALYVCTMEKGGTLEDGLKKCRNELMIRVESLTRKTKGGIIVS
jgi:hypothetical protein